MLGRIAALHRYPIKGFSPERLPAAVPEPGRFFPGDRLLAVENGPSGFDPGAPSFIPKTAFTVLAAIPEVARIRTAYDPETRTLGAEAPGQPAMRADLSKPAGRRAFVDWLAVTLGEAAQGPLKLIEGPPHRFTDHIKGHVSLLNLESVRSLGRAMGAELDPLRFRANLHVEGWPAFAEEGLRPGDRLKLGAAELELFKPIARCAAVEVDPQAGVRDLPVVAGLFNHRGHVHCGLYLQVLEGGRLAEGDSALMIDREAAA
jgi:uncharacterized protein YcbX